MAGAGQQLPPPTPLSRDSPAHARTVSWSPVFGRIVFCLLSSSFIAMIVLPGVGPIRPIHRTRRNRTWTTRLHDPRMLYRRDRRQADIGSPLPCLYDSTRLYDSPEACGNPVLQLRVPEDTLARIDAGAATTPAPPGSCASSTASSPASGPQPRRPAPKPLPP